MRAMASRPFANSDSLKALAPDTSRSLPASFSEEPQENQARSWHLESHRIFAKRFDHSPLKSIAGNFVDGDLAIRS